MIYYSKLMLNDFALNWPKHIWPAEGKISLNRVKRLGGRDAMYKCELYEVDINNAGTMYSIKCGDECRLVSFSLKKVEKIMQNCNQYGIDPIHLSEIIEDEMLED